MSKNILQCLSGLLNPKELLLEEEEPRFQYEAINITSLASSYVEVLIELTERKLGPQFLDWLESLGAWNFIYFSPCLSFCMEGDIETVAGQLTGHWEFSKVMRVKSISIAFEAVVKSKSRNEKLFQQASLAWEN